MLKTCKKIEKPPIPNKNAERIILIEICFILICESLFIPLVISKNPVNILVTNSDGICNNSQIGLKKIKIKFVIPTII